MKYHKKFIFISLVNLFFVFNIFNSSLFSLHENYTAHEYAQLFTQAEKLRADGEFDDSIVLFKKILDIAKKAQNEINICNSLLKLGLLHWIIDKLEESSVYYNQALELAEKSNLKSKLGRCKNALEIYKLHEKGKKFRNSSKEYQKSIDSFEKAIDLARKIDSKEHEVRCLRQLSITYWKLNNFKEFHSLNEKALEIARSLNHRKEEGRCLNNIGLHYWKLTNYSKALACYKKSIGIAEKLNNKKSKGMCLNNIGLIYLEIGSYDKALDYLEKALSINKKSGNESSISYNLNNFGETYRRKGILSGDENDFNKAVEYYNKCLEYTRRTRDRKTEALVINNIGSAYSESGKYKNALKYFKLGLKKAEEIQDFEIMSMILTNIGVVQYNLGNYEGSTKYYERAIALALGRDQILWEAYMESGRSYEKKKEYKKAMEHYKDSIRTIEDIRSTIDLEELKAKYLGTDKRIDAYHYLINLFVNSPSLHLGEEYKREAFNYLEKAKARAFLDSLELSKVDLSKGVDPELLNREKETMNDISQVHTKLMTAEQSPEVKENLKEDLKKFENELETLKREMRRKSPAYANVQWPEIIALDKAQNELLDSKKAFFEYCIGKEHSFAFVVTKKDLKIFSLPKRADLRKQVTEYLKVINDKDNQNFQPGYELFRMLILPGLDKSIKKIIFIPDDILHFFPFETLITDKEKNNWLIQKYKIAYAPSISSLREIIQRKKSNGERHRKDILAFGDPYFGKLETEENGNDIFHDFFSSDAYSSDALNFYRLKYSGVEIDRISPLFKKSKTKVFRRENASEEQLKNPELNLKDYKIIHFATHSIIDNKIPARSSIVLSLDNDQSEDGFLQMREIYNLKLNADLVTLSSCQTGLGELIRGEGIEGINRAFFYAGASSVLMSLWAVNDQASYQLMERFYHYLRSSESIKNALRKAKLKMINSGVLSHPYYWAGFIASGKTDEVIFPSSASKWLLFGLPFLLASGLIAAVVINFKKKLYIAF